MTAESVTWTVPLKRGRDDTPRELPEEIDSADYQPTKRRRLSGGVELTFAIGAERWILARVSPREVSPQEVEVITTATGDVPNKMGPVSVPARESGGAWCVT